MLRVLYVTYSLEPAGAERLIYALATNLDRERFIPLVCSLKHGGALVDALRENKVTVYLLNKRNTFDFATFRALKEIIRNEQIDIIHTHNFSANFWGRIAAMSVNTCRIIATEHSLSIRKGWLRKKIDRFLARYTDRIVSVSEAVRHSLIDEEGIEPEKILSIHNGINIEKFRHLRNPESVREELGIDANAPVVGIVGRLIPDKGHKYFLEAARAVQKKVPEVRFLVVGDGKLKGELEVYVHKFGLKGSVLFTGFRSDRIDIMNIFTIAILSSIREGLPITLLEYMALKKPIIVTKVGGMPEVIEDGISGIVIQKKNYHALTESIVKLLGDERLRIKYGNNAWKCVKNKYSEENMIRKTERLYEEMAKKILHCV